MPNMFQFISEVFSVSEVRFHPQITMSSLGLLCVSGHCDQAQYFQCIPRHSIIQICASNLVTTLWERTIYCFDGQVFTNRKCFTVYIRFLSSDNYYLLFGRLIWFMSCDMVTLACCYGAAMLSYLEYLLRFIYTPTAGEAESIFIQYKQKHALSLASLLRVRQDQGLTFLLRQKTTCTQHFWLCSCTTLMNFTYNI